MATRFRLRRIVGRWLVCVATVCLVSVVGLDESRSQGDQQSEQQAVAPADLDDRVLAALGTRGDWSFIDTTLAELVDYLSEAAKVDIVADVRALEDVGIGLDVPITCEVKGVTLRSFLRLMLRDLDLTYEVRDATLWITTPEQAESQLAVRIYGVSDLIRSGDDHDESAYDYDSLIELITSSIEPDAWDEVGGPGSIDGIYGALVVSQVRTIHDDIQRFLQVYRRVAQHHREHPAEPAPGLFVGNPEEDRIRQALNQPVSIDLHESPLGEAATCIANLTGIPIVIDNRALDEYGLASETPVTAKVTQLPLRFALRRILYQLELSWMVRDEVLVITTLEDCESIQPICFYPVADLVTVSGDGGRNPAEFDFDSLIEVVTSAVEPDTWDEVGGPGSIEANVHPPALVVAQTEDVHEMIKQLLAQLRVAKRQERESRAAGDVVAAPRILQVVSYPLDGVFPANEVSELIKKVLGRETWNEQDALLETVGNSIVVRHTSRVHQRVARLLMQLKGGGGFGGGGLGGGGFGGGGGGGFGGGGMF